MEQTPQFKRYWACQRKRKYRSEQAAMNMLDRIKKTGKIIPHNANAYRCTYCDGWHLGHAKVE